MYKYFVDLGDRMEVATVRTVYIDEVRSKISKYGWRWLRIQARQAETEKSKMVYGMGVAPTTAAVEDNDDDEEFEGYSRTVKSGQRVSPVLLYASGTMIDRAE